VAGLLVGDSCQPVGGIPGVGVYAVIEQVAISIVAIGGTACGDNLVQRIDGQGDAGFADANVGQIGGCPEFCVNGVWVKARSFGLRTG